MHDVRVVLEGKEQSGVYLSGDINWVWKRKTHRIQVFASGYYAAATGGER
jgi:hypothetical protein